jgi:transposase-like protein
MPKCNEHNNFADLDLPCPRCKKKTGIKVHNDTVLIRFPLYCSSCHREFCVNVVNLKLVQIHDKR